jgi:hypothetical protein
MTERIAPADGRAALRYWRAVAQLPVDREAALTELAACFRAGEAPATLSGDLAGRLLATTLGHGLDVPLEALARAWMPEGSRCRDGPGLEHVLPRRGAADASVLAALL